MLIDNGEIIEFTSVSGTYTYDSSSEPTIFEGDFFQGVKETIKTIGKRITYGGQVAHDQRVYYINTKVITGNKFGSPNPKKITDEKYGMLEITFFGEYAFRVVNPATLIMNIIGSNAKDTITYDEIIESQLKTKFIEQFSEALAKVMLNKKVSFGDIGLYSSEIATEMNQILDESWKKQYGLIITDVAIGDINLTEESMKRVNKIDDANIFSDQKLQSGLIASSVSEGIINASSNANGSIAGFAGLNMASNTGGSIINNINQKNNDNHNKTNCTNCGTEVHGKFCHNCGTEIK